MASRVAFAVAVALGMLALVAAIPSNKVITAFNNAAQVRARRHRGLSFCGTGRGLQARAHRMQELRYALRYSLRPPPRACGACASNASAPRCSAHFWQDLPL
jgi:hypothetical protein